MIRLNSKIRLFTKNMSVFVNQNMPKSDISEFREIFKSASRVVALTGAGISAESGVPTFRGAGGYWRNYESQSLATMNAFKKNPSLVWEFYSYRRELVLQKKPNAAHYALATAEKMLDEQGKRLVVITQNIDELHRLAGTQKILELHGSLYKTLCMECGDVGVNHDSPACPALKDKGAPDPDTEDARIPVELLPRCKKCSGLLRPYVVWFGESLDGKVLSDTQSELDSCDLCLVIGTSSVVYPAAMFAPQLASAGVPVAEFNLEATPQTMKFGFHFEGKCGETLPKALGI